MSATHQKIMIAKKATQNSLYEPNFDPEKDLNGGGILQILFKEPSENYFPARSFASPEERFTSALGNYPQWCLLIDG